MIIYHAILKVKKDLRNNYLNDIKNSNMIPEFLNQPGCVFYTMGASLMDDDSVIVCDAWEDRTTFETHCKSAIVQETWNSLQKKYVTEVDNRTYDF